ncbi:MAG TPA: ATP-binding protein [Candidatus Aquilonibacter sp.]|jgi:signal transduction histidine kinase/CheY-like chemotaxis protein|nr:ATP-binding protein [Candidatus Aquilonibacter sp.]
MNLLTIQIRFENDVVLARQKSRAIASALKFDPQDQIRIATAVSEIARNTFQYAGGGMVEFRIDESPEKVLIVTVRDKGKGIPNLDEIIDGKYVSQTGMGLGILGAKRLMDHFHVETNPGRGTTVVLGKKISPRFPRLVPAELNKVLASIEHASKDDPYEELKHQNKELMDTLEQLRAKQEELAQLNRELDETNRGVVALYAELNERADFLQHASELKTRFLSNMSHEFRTPLNSITALSQILLDRLDGDLLPEQEKQVRYISNSARDLTELVNDLLDLAKVEAGKVTIHPTQFSVESLFAALRGMLRPLLSQNSSVTLTFEDPEGCPELYSDEAKVSQILRNFISNALKFTERGEVRVSATRGQADTVIFTVADTGIGISPEDQDRIFQEWTQIDGKLQRTVKGTGLGLPLSKKFAQLLGGDAQVRSQLGTGSTFFAVIPIHFSGETEIVFAPELKREIDSTKFSVLVVEDNPEALFIYEKYLKGTRFQPIPAKSIKEARQALRDFRPLAVILDVLLQGEHSWDLLQEMKHDASTSDMPVFVVTVIDNREKALALGADGFHAKPVDRNWLMQQLENAVRKTASKKVLLIDDDEVSRYVVKTVLGQINLRISEASGGADGLQKAAEERPDMIILDLSMPDISGVEVLRKLKENPRTKTIPVIIHTSRVLDAAERQSLSAAITIISKESESRDRLLELFTDAFNKAGVSTGPIKEEQHV